MTPDPHATSHEGPHLRTTTTFTKRKGSPIAFQHPFSIFYHSLVNLRNHYPPSEIPDVAGPGWYWEDSEEKPAGPFRTSALAYVDATRGNYP